MGWVVRVREWGKGNSWGVSRRDDGEGQGCVGWGAGSIVRKMEWSVQAQDDGCRVWLLQPAGFLPQAGGGLTC